MLAARELASGHDHRIAQSYLTIHRNRKLRHAIEVRHESFVNPQFIRLLRRYHAALVVSDSTEHWPCIEDVTADFVYLRLHGTESKYAGAYSDPALQRWARRRVFCYFDSDTKTQAPFDAQRLIEIVARAGSSTAADEATR
ncbi:DUF72 domain-containing protein [Mycetohabitans sp. B5]|uniref:Uncharacterized protein DUF72 n=1 Tax=Mycetohabitans endofungorum TaxID=417203 RepID=A0A2P5KDM2_9BURK|nr:DUF72 domain-containing protein [Mycetohabitans sp. B5]PPB84775.1 uncharacterized protein DUF72 [Mycetohabitans endofungorum]